MDSNEASIYVECRVCDHCNHAGINDTDRGEAACTDCEWSGDSPVEDKCPSCQREGTMTAACPKCGRRYSLIAETEVAALSQHPGVPEQEYRLLRRGEAILATDQLLRDDCTSWEPVTGIGIGMAYDPAAFVPIRRAAAPQPGKEG